MAPLQMRLKEGGEGVVLASMARNTLLTFGRQFLAGFLRIGALLLVARMLGPAGAGAYAVALVTPTVLAQLLNFGLPTANVYFLASGRLALAQLWSSCIIVAALGSTVGLAIGGWAIVVHGEAWFPGVPEPVLLTLLCVLPFALLFGVVTSLFQAAEDFRSFNALVLVEPLLTFILLCGLWAAGAGTLAAAALATLLAHAMASAAAVALSVCKLETLRPQRVSRADFLALVGYSLKSHLSNVVSLLNYRVDLFIVNLLAGPYAAGLYSTAMRMAEQVSIISQAVSTVLFPRLSAMAKDEAARQALTAVVARAALWVTLAAAVAVASLSGLMVPILFGTEFGPAVAPLLVLLPGLALFACSRVLAHGLAARGLTTVNLGFSVAALILNVIGNVIFVPRYGPVGAAAVTSSIYASDLAIRLVLSKPLVGMAWWRVILPSKEDFRTIVRAIRSSEFRG
jgi:O-antigen/teichoic acid export membrane protein